MAEQNAVSRILMRPTGTHPRSRRSSPAFQAGAFKPTLSLRLRPVIRQLEPGRLRGDLNMSLLVRGEDGIQGADGYRDPVGNAPCLLDQNSDEPQWLQNCRSTDSDDA